MAQKISPILYVNLGGEMFYVLFLRLKALNCNPEKISNVLGEMAIKMYHEKTLNELFNKTSISHLDLKAVYKLVIQSSAITIPEASMNTLYDLMTMVYKYQIFSIKRAEDLLLVMLNHMDEVRKMCPREDKFTNLFKNLHKEIIKNYARLTPSAYIMIREQILDFLKDFNIRVSILMKEGKQGEDGRFVVDKEAGLPMGFQQAGDLRTFKEGAEKPFTKQTETSIFDSGTTGVMSIASLAFEGSRVIKLGTNIYENNVDQLLVSSTSKMPQPEDYLRHQDPKYKAEMEYLMGLIGAPRESANKIRLDLDILRDDDDDDDDGGAGGDAVNKSSSASNVTTQVKASVVRGHLSKVMKEMKMDGGRNDEDDDDMMKYFD